MEAGVPTFPAYVTLGIYLALLPTTLIAIFRYKDTPTRFLIFAIWLRYLMSAFHQYTYPPVAGGLSLNALGAITITGIGFLVIDQRLLLLKAFGGVYLMIIVTVISGLVNNPTDAVSSLTKWFYLVALTAAAYEALRRHGSHAVFRTLIIAFLPPLVLQALSVATGLSKGSEADGTICYIGGYNHEAAFSIIVLTFLYCLCFLEPDRPIVTFMCVPIALVALLLANYRTSLLAALPILIATALIGTLRRIAPSERPFVLVLLSLTGAVLLCAAGIAMQQRFNDLFVVLSNGSGLIKPPQYYTSSDEELLSARAIIWSRYITAYLHGTITNIAFGFGPDSWETVFTRYAHNTFVSALYEMGTIGLIGLVTFFILNFRLALRTASDRRPVVIGAHIGFLALNMATMPLWLIEGNALLALTMAYTLHIQVPRRARVANISSKVELGRTE